jgi:hypothetical protein
MHLTQARGRLIPVEQPPAAPSIEQEIEGAHVTLGAARIPKCRNCDTRQIWLVSAKNNSESDQAFFRAPVVERLQVEGGVRVRRLARVPHVCEVGDDSSAMGSQTSRRRDSFERGLG